MTLLTIQLVHSMTQDHSKLPNYEQPQDLLLQCSEVTQDLQVPTAT